MTYLLDTHTFLWLVSSPGLLPSRVLGIIMDRSASILVSIVTPWEIAIKHATGKLQASQILDNFEAKVTHSKLEMIATSVPQVIRAGGLPLHHRDPFDRLLVAQALDLQIPILSADRMFDRYSVQRIWA